MCRKVSQLHGRGSALRDRMPEQEVFQAVPFRQSWGFGCVAHGMAVAKILASPIRMPLLSWVQVTPLTVP